MKDKEILNNILLNDDIENSIRNNEEIIFKIIPELKYEKGFLQKNKYHCYDVLEHTINALIDSEKDFNIRIILLLHDIGKPFCCQEDGEVRHFKGHAIKSAEISKNILNRLGYDEEFINEICFYIENHATTIKEEFISMDNIDKYKKLLYIQYCDSSAYHPKYAKEIKEKLDKIKYMIECIEETKVLKKL